MKPRNTVLGPLNCSEDDSGQAEMFLGDWVIVDIEMLPVSILLQPVGKELFVDVVVEIVHGDLHLGWLANIVLVDGHPRHRQLQLLHPSPERGKRLLTGV